MQRTSESVRDHHYKPIGILGAEFLSRSSYYQSTSKEQHTTIIQIINGEKEYYTGNVKEYITDAI